jgi:hypothetical protein
MTFVMDQASPFVATPLLANIGVSQICGAEQEQCDTAHVANCEHRCLGNRFDWRQSKYRSSPPHDVVAEEPSPAGKFRQARHVALGGITH